MSGKTDTFENDLLKLIFNGTAIANLADNAAASPLTTLYISLHTADPGDAAASGQATSEVTYTGYARVAIARTGSGWVVTGSSVSPAASVDFGQCTAGTMTATYAGIGTASSGNGKLLYSGALSPAVSISSGVIPRITTSSTITED